jgi:hypothetical protein
MKRAILLIVLLALAVVLTACGYHGHGWRGGHHGGNYGGQNQYGHSWN